MALTPNASFFYRTNDLPIDPYAGDAQLATSLDDWAGTREIQMYSWANAAARGLEVNMVAGAEGYQADTQLTYKYNGTAWKAWHTIQPLSYTPTWTNLTVGNGTQMWTYALAAGVVFAKGFFTFGTTSSVGTGPYMTLPLPANGYITSAPNSGTGQILGPTNLVDFGSPFVQGVCTTRAVTSVIYAAIEYSIASTANVTQTQISATAPFTWGSTDFFTANFSYVAD